MRTKRQVPATDPGAQPALPVNPAPAPAPVAAPIPINTSPVQMSSGGIAVPAQQLVHPATHVSGHSGLSIPGIIRFFNTHVALDHVQYDIRMRS